MSKAKSELASISKQPALFTDPIFNDGFGNDELAMEHQLVHMYYLRGSFTNYVDKNLAFLTT